MQRRRSGRQHQCPIFFSPVKNILHKKLINYPPPREIHACSSGRHPSPVKPSGLKMYRCYFVKVKVKVRSQDTCYSAMHLHESDLWPAALYNLGSGIWLAWANGATAHYVASIACANGQLHAPTVQLADTPSPQSATLGLHPVAVATTYFPVPLGVGGELA